METEFSIDPTLIDPFNGEFEKDPRSQVTHANLLKEWGVEIPADMLAIALTHRSWAYENNAEHNERLEFLGDAILGAVVVNKIFRDYRNKSEGDLSKIKAAAVSERALAIVARKLHLGDHIFLGRGEEMSGGREKESILSDTVEALIGATLLTCGLSTTVGVIRDNLSEVIIQAHDMGPALDWRTAVDEKSREIGITEPLTYQMEATGPDHARLYTAHVYFGLTRWGSGSATSQRAAKLVACEDAYGYLVEGKPPVNEVPVNKQLASSQPVSEPAGDKDDQVTSLHHA